MLCKQLSGPKAIAYYTQPHGLCTCGILAARWEAADTFTCNDLSKEERQRGGRHAHLAEAFKTSQNSHFFADRVSVTPPLPRRGSWDAEAALPGKDLHL